MRCFYLLIWSISALGRIRTDNYRVLSALPLPIGLQGHNLRPNLLLDTNARSLHLIHWH